MLASWKTYAEISVPDSVQWQFKSCELNLVNMSCSLEEAPLLRGQWLSIKLPAETNKDRVR